MKVLIITEEIEKILTFLCDASLKSVGLQAHQLVNKLISSIETKESQTFQNNAG